MDALKRMEMALESNNKADENLGSQYFNFIFYGAE